MSNMRLYIKSHKNIIAVNISDIIICKARGRYTDLITSSGNILISRNIGQIEILLEQDNFFRVHHSYIININFVTEYSLKTNEINLANNETVKLSVRKKKEFTKKLNCCL